jgi:hypothetical protein
MFLCPKQWQPKMEKSKPPVTQPSVKVKEDSEEEVDDFYIFW